MLNSTSSTDRIYPLARGGRLGPCLAPDDVKAFARRSRGFAREADWSPERRGTADGGQNMLRFVGAREVEVFTARVS